LAIPVCGAGSEGTVIAPARHAVETRFERSCLLGHNP
jgi:hypothetical protein